MSLVPSSLKSAYTTPAFGSGDRSDFFAGDFADFLPCVWERQRGIGFLERVRGVAVQMCTVNSFVSHNSLQNL